MNDNYPKFSLDGSKYDQSTYWGRFLGFLDVVDPQTLLTSDKELDDALALLEEYKTNGNQAPVGITDKDLWTAKKIRDAVIHPGTGEKINPLLRMSAFVPINVPIIAGMLSTTSLGGTLFWQWANQSYNSALNYTNRSGAEMSMEELGTSYGIAVGLSCGLATAFRYLGQKGPLLFRRAAAIPFVIPYIAVGSAGAANVYFTRRPEITNGVAVTDADGKTLGISKEAGKLGVLQTIVSRSLGLPLPVLVLPPILMKAVPAAVGARGRMGFELLAVTLCLTGALPAAIAMFPQKLELDVSSLESEFQNLVDSDGNPITKVYSNKGL